MIIRLLIYLSFLVLTPFKSNPLPEIRRIDSMIYLYEYSMKKPSQIDIGFIVIEDGEIVQNTSFKIRFTRNKLKSVVKTNCASNDTQSYSIIDKGIIRLDATGMTCYSSGHFEEREQQIPSKFYYMISPLFLDVTNIERLHYLNHLSSKTLVL